MAVEGDADAVDADGFAINGDRGVPGVEGFEEDDVAVGVESLEGEFVVVIGGDDEGVGADTGGGYAAFYYDQVVVLELGFHGFSGDVQGDDSGVG